MAEELADMEAVGKADELEFIGEAAALGEVVERDVFDNCWSKVRNQNVE